MVVVGGGNVTMGAARTALRLGADEVVMVFRRSLAELPARKEEVHHAQEEGIRFELCTNPVRIMGLAGDVTAVECVRMDLCELDASGRRTPKPIPGSEFTIPADIVVTAVGTGANPLIADTTRDLAVNRRKYIVADPETGRTSREGVYAGGDIVPGSTTVISAMGARRKAAKAMHEYLMTKKRRSKSSRPTGEHSLSHVSEPRRHPTPPNCTNNPVRCSITKNTRVIYIIYS